MQADVMRRRLAAIMAADMVGYSRLVHADEAGTIARQKACFQDVITPRLQEFGGRLVKTTGDGFLVEFASSVDALLCSVSIQRDLAKDQSEQPDDQKIVYRIGINAGDVIEEDGDILGEGVNVAARLEALADPGGIHISRSVYRNVQGKLDLGFADLGELRVKNIADPVGTYKVLLDPSDAGKTIRSRSLPWRAILVAACTVGCFLIGLLLWDRSRLQPVRDVTAPRLLILPFQEQAGSAPWAEVVSENLWLTLVRAKSLTIVSREVSLELRGVEASPENLKDLGPITHVLDGSVARDAGGVRVQARLRQFHEGELSGLDQYDLTGPIGNEMQVLTALKTNISEDLGLRLSQPEREAVFATFTNNPAAFLPFAKASHLIATEHWNHIPVATKLYQDA